LTDQVCGALIRYRVFSKLHVAAVAGMYSTKGILSRIVSAEPRAIWPTGGSQLLTY